MPSPFWKMSSGTSACAFRVCRAGVYFSTWKKACGRFIGVVKMIQPKLLVVMVTLAGDHVVRLLETRSCDSPVAFCAATTTF